MFTKVQNWALGLVAGFGVLYACSSSDDDVTPRFDCGANPVSLSLNSSSPSACDQATGEISVTASGGGGEGYRYSINDGPFRSGGVFSQLTAGTYQIKARDQNNCEASLSVTLTDESGIVLEFDIVPSGCGESNGVINASVEGASGNLMFSLNGGAFQESGTFTNLEADGYSVTVKDNQGCGATAFVQVTSGITYQDHIRPLVQSKCAISGCHVSGTGRVNFNSLSNIQQNAAEMKSRTQSRDMPRTGSLTQAQIDQLACWVDDGALNN
ncbi:hypothetical protein AAG747_17515 [Rapidithrix thailandica]|uniref:SprB repeat-containing protein n=1 Tax=Rapidithrix thailandica TaxID=413964 RepID=A0AAW9SG94_9BACT